MKIAAQDIIDAARKACAWADESSQAVTQGCKEPYYAVHLIRDTYLDEATGPAAPTGELAWIAGRPIAQQLGRAPAASPHGAVHLAE